MMMVFPGREDHRILRSQHRQLNRGCLWVHPPEAPRIIHQSARDGYALLLAAGKLERFMIQAISQTDSLGQSGGD